MLERWGATWPTCHGVPRVVRDWKSTLVLRKFLKSFWNKKPMGLRPQPSERSVVQTFGCYFKLSIRATSEKRIPDRSDFKNQMIRLLFFFLFVAGLIRKESHNNKGTPKNNTWIPDFVTDCSLWKRWLHLFAEKWTVEQVIRCDYMITLVSRKRILKLLISYWQWQHSIVYSSWEYTGDIRDIPGHTSNFPPFMGCTDDFLSSFYLMHFACSMGFWSIAIVRRDYINVSIAKMFNSCNDSWSKNTLTYNQHLTVTTFSKHIFSSIYGYSRRQWMVRRETPVSYAEIRRLKPLPTVKWWVYKCPLVLIQLRPAGSEADSRDTVERMADQLQVPGQCFKPDVALCWMTFGLILAQELEERNQQWAHSARWNPQSWFKLQIEVAKKYSSTS